MVNRHHIPYVMNISLRWTGEGTTSVSVARYDRSSQRMVFEHLLDLMGDPEDDGDAASMLQLGAAELANRVALRAQEEG